MKDTPKKVKKLSEKEPSEKELTDKEASSVVGGYRPLRTGPGTDDAGTRDEGTKKQSGGDEQSQNKENGTFRIFPIF